MSLETIEALNKFKIIPKPEDNSRCRGKYDDLIIAIKNLVGDKAIELPLNYIGGISFANWLSGIKMRAKKLHNIRVHGFVEHGVIKIWRRNS